MKGDVVRSRKLARMIRATVFLFIFILSASGASAAPDSTPLDGGQIDKILVAAHAAAGGAQLDAFVAVTQSGTFVQNGGPLNSFDSVADLHTAIRATGSSSGRQRCFKDTTARSGARRTAHFRSSAYRPSSPMP